MKLAVSRQIFEKSSNVKCNGNPFSGSRVVPRGRTDRQSDVTKLVVAFRNFSIAPERSIVLKSKTRSVSSECPLSCSATRSFQDCSGRLLHILRSIETSGTGYLVTQRHNPGKLIAHYLTLYSPCILYKLKLILIYSALLIFILTINQSFTNRARIGNVPLFFPPHKRNAFKISVPLSHRVIILINSINNIPSICKTP
jgi:hypothetical protein